MKTSKLPLTAFLLLSVVIASFLAFFARNLLPVYLDRPLRSSVTESMKRMADERGWLLSDMSVFCSVTSNLWTVHHQDHLRFSVSDEFLELDSSLPPCDD